MDFEPVRLPAGYQPGVTDIGPAVQATVNAIEPEGRGGILLPPGPVLWNSPVYLDAATRELTYFIQGHGRGTDVRLGAGLGTGYAVYVNQTASGAEGITYPRHPRLVVRDLFLSGERNFAYGRQASAEFERIRANRVRRLYECIGYTDLMTFRKISWEVPAGAMYVGRGNGDGLLISQITAFADDTIAELSDCNGGVIESIIGGRFVFSNCDGIEFLGSHLDTKGNGGADYVTQPWVTIRNSRIAFRNGWDHIGPNAPVFEIADAGQGHSQVVFDHYDFGFRPHVPGKLRAPHVRIASATDGTKVSFRHCTGRLLPFQNQNRYLAGPSVAAADPAIQAAIDARPTGPLEDADLMRTTAGWRFVSPPPVFGRQLHHIAVAPTVSASASAVVDGTGGSFTYRVATVTDKFRGLTTAASAPATGTAPAGQSVALVVNPQTAPALVRVWRGTDRFVDVPVAAATTLFDTGPAVSGFAWKTTGVPPVPTVNSTRNEWLPL